MGPRPEGHGEQLFLVTVYIFLDVLQWGHVQKDMERSLSPNCGNLPVVGFNGATSRRTWRERFRWSGGLNDKQLQWGHVQKDMESLTGKAMPRLIWSFNGATSRRTWRDQDYPNH